MTRFTDRVSTAVAEKDSCLVVGLDPVLERLPEEIPRDDPAEAFRRFAREVIAAVAPYAVAIKPQIAFYEVLGADGWRAYEDAIATARAHGLVVIGDVKRGDIGSTAAAYARAHLRPAAGRTVADAITVNPYLGGDGVRPFVDEAREHGGGVFVLVRTSNPSSAELQGLAVAGGGTVDERVAALVNTWGSDDGDTPYSDVGAVVGATHAEALARLRAAMPRAWFLVPGVGAQGGTPDDVAGAFGADGRGVLVNASRSILYAHETRADVPWRDAVADAALELRDALRTAARSATR